MGRGPSYNVPYRRRRDGRTNYALRKRAIASDLPRFVVRKTRKHIMVQLARSTVAGDEVITAAHSSELKKYDWIISLDNLPAAYLTGLLCGYRSTAKGVKEAVLDIGLQSPSQGARVFAALKGLIDAGVEIPHGEDVLPDEKRITGQHVADYLSTIASNPDTQSHLFSTHLSEGLTPQKIPETFSSVKAKIIDEFKKKV